jgi:hypothetical protein
MVKYGIVTEAAAHCWGKVSIICEYIHIQIYTFIFTYTYMYIYFILLQNFMEVFKDFFARHAEAFIDAPTTISGEQNLEYYSLFQVDICVYT